MPWHPDVVTITGDTGEAAPEIIAADLAPLLDLRATDGVFYALGNHESYRASGLGAGSMRPRGTCCATATLF